MKLIKVALAVLAGLSAVGIAAAPASAGTDPLGGTVINSTPYTMKVASFEGGAPSNCYIWNSQGNATTAPVTWRCRTANMGPRGSSPYYDTDGFTFTGLSNGGYYVRFNSPSEPSASYHWVANGTWTRIHGWVTAVCRWESGEERYDVYCTVQ